MHCKPVVRSDGKTYESAAVAARELGVCESHVSAAARGDQKSCKGFAFWYVGEPEKTVPPQQARPVLMDGEVYFPSAAAAAKHLGTARQCVSLVARGKFKTIHGHTFAYIDECKDLETDKLEVSND
jgi:hypothetical protein